MDCPLIADLLNLARTCRTIHVIAHDVLQRTMNLRLSCGNGHVTSSLRRESNKRFTDGIRSLCLRDISWNEPCSLELPLYFANLKKLAIHNIIIKYKVSFDRRSVKSIPKLELPFSFDKVDLTNTQESFLQKLIKAAIDEATQPSMSRHRTNGARFNSWWTSEMNFYETILKQFALAKTRGYDLILNINFHILHTGRTRHVSRGLRCIRKV